MNTAIKIKEIVASRGISYTFLSQKTGITVDRLSKSFNGKRKLPADEMVMICKILQIDLKDLMDTGR